MSKSKPSKSAQRAAQAAQEEANRIQAEMKLMNENTAALNTLNTVDDRPTDVQVGGSVDEYDTAQRKKRQGASTGLSSTLGVGL